MMLMVSPSADSITANRGWYSGDRHRNKLRSNAKFPRKIKIMASSEAGGDHGFAHYLR